MNKEHFKCRFCDYETYNWKLAEEHFINKHKKKQILIKKNESVKIKKNKIEKISKNKFLMDQRIIELKINATPAECYLKDKFKLFLNKDFFIFQKGFYFNKSDFFYIVDFFFPQKNLVIEIDGEYHQVQEQRKKDSLREEKLKRIFNLKFLRYTNEQVYNNLFKILQDINDTKNIDSIKEAKIKIIKKEKVRIKCEFCPIICKSLKKLQNHIKNTHKK